MGKSIASKLKRRIPRHYVESVDIAYDVAEFMAKNPRALNGQAKAAASGAAPWNPVILEQELNQLRISRTV